MLKQKLIRIADIEKCVQIFYIIFRMEYIRQNSFDVRGGCYFRYLNRGKKITKISNYDTYIHILLLYLYYMVIGKQYLG